MVEYIDCGVKLGWLIDPDSRRVEIYRRGQSKEVLENPASLSGEELLPSLEVSLKDVFE